MVFITATKHINVISVRNLLEDRILWWKYFNKTGSLIVEFANKNRFVWIFQYHESPIRQEKVSINFIQNVLNCFYTTSWLFTLLNMLLLVHHNLDRQPTGYIKRKNFIKNRKGLFLSFNEGHLRMQVIKIRPVLKFI